MMRILQIVPSIALIYGGPSQMVLGLSKALAAQGIDVTILTTNSNGDAGQKPLEVPIAQPIERDGYRIIHFSCFPFRRYKYSLPLLNWLQTHAKEYDLAHIHALFSPVSTAAATIARKQNLPYILRPLGTLDPADLKKKRLLKKLYVSLWEKSNLAGAAALHFTSQQEAKISERFGIKTTDLVMPIGVELPVQLPAFGEARDRLNIKSDRVLLLFMSRIDPKKGLDLLLPALKILAAEGWDFDFVLAGTNPQDPDYENEIHKQIKNSTLANRTTITGFVTGESKFQLLRDADLFVLPSYYENFGISVAEAMAIGTPVVISDRVHIYNEIEQAEAGWVANCNIEDLTAKLRLALQDRIGRIRRGLYAKEYALNNYSWNSIALQTIEAYRSLKNSYSHDSKIINK
jgi:glycosyltransferase involved in cell wall biosynthesis